MATQTIIRGTLIAFSTTFADANGTPVVPASATLYITYSRVDGTHAPPVQIVMTQSAGVFSAQWDSSVSSGNPVYWSVRSATPAIADDGTIKLTANPANPPPPP